MGIPVGELTERMSYEEVVEWAGYERAVTPLDNSRLEELLIVLLREVQMVNWLVGETKFKGSENGKVYPNPFGDEPPDLLEHPSDRNSRFGPSELLAGMVANLPFDPDDDEDDYDSSDDDIDE